MLLGRGGKWAEGVKLIYLVLFSLLFRELSEERKV